MNRTFIAAGALLLAATASHAFKLESPDIKANGTIPKGFEANVFGCNGENKSPVLKWTGAPTTPASTPPGARCRRLACRASTV